MKKKYKLWVVLLSVVVGFFVVLTGTYFTTKLKTFNEIPNPSTNYNKRNIMFM